jgi:DNA end-binding protein Ku
MGTGTVSFGLVAIPVKFYKAVSAESARFNQLTPEGHRLKQQYVDAITADVVNRADMIKGYEYARGQYVTFTEAELKDLELTGADKTVSIEACVPSSDLDLVQVEASYYLGPDKGGDKAYRLLAETLSETGRVAIAQWATRGREHLVAIRAYGGGLILHTLYYADEVRNQREVLDGVPELDASAKERDLARMLVAQMDGHFELGRYQDRYRQRVLSAVDAKVAGREVVLPAVAAAPQIVDLYEALTKSLGDAQAKAKATKAAAKKAPRRKKASKKAA